MPGPETLSAGRNWLANQRAATTVFEPVEFENNARVVRGDALIDSAAIHPPSPKFSAAFLAQSTAKVLLSPDAFQRLASEESNARETHSTDAAGLKSRFLTESIYRQLHGVDAEPVSRLESLEIPSLCDAHPMTPDHQIVFASIPNVAPAHLNSELVSNVKIVSLHSDDLMLSEDVMVANPEQQVNGQPIYDQDCRSDEESCDQIDALVAKIFERFPIAAPTMLLFVGTEQNPHVDETCARVASAIAQRNVGDVLLIDADVEGRRLSRVSGLEDHSGVTECINRNQDWQEKVVSQFGSSFGFLPVGNCEMDRWNAEQLLRNAAAEMKRDYQFICVSAGNTHSPHAGLWFDICDGTYLVVSMTSSNPDYARSAVEELKSRSARLLGCVVTDVA